MSIRVACPCRRTLYAFNLNLYTKSEFTRGVQISVQLGKYHTFNHDLHEIVHVSYRWLCNLSIDTIHV